MAVAVCGHLAAVGLVVQGVCGITCGGPACSGLVRCVLAAWLGWALCACGVGRL